MSLPFTGEGDLAAGEAPPRPRHGAKRSCFVTGAARALMPVAVPGRGAMGWGGLEKARGTQILASLPHSPTSARQAVGAHTDALNKKHLFVPGWHYGMVCFVPIHGKRMNYFFVSGWTWIILNCFKQ